MGDFFLGAQTARVVLSTISIIGSSVIDVMIIKNDGLRASPYSRIIFGLSFGDIMLSLGLLLGPFAAPKTTRGAVWAIGNVASCEAIGFVMNMGISVVPFYVAFLAFYFDQRVRHKLSRQAFAKKYEMKLHIMIWLYPFIGGIVAICLNLFNPGIRGNVCVMTDQPRKCAINDKIDCLRTDKTATEMFKYYQMFVPFLTSFLIMVYCLVRLTVFVYQQEKMFLPEDQKNISWKERFGNWFKSKETEEDSNDISNGQGQEDNASTDREQDTTGENIAAVIGESGKNKAYSSQNSPLFEQSDVGSNSNQLVHGGLNSMASEMKKDSDIEISCANQSSLIAQSNMSDSIATVPKEQQILDSIVSEMEDIGTDSRVDGTFERVMIQDDVENNNTSNKTSARTSMTNSNETERRAVPITQSNQLAKAALLQSFLYISAWLLTYSIPIVGITASMFGASLPRPLALVLWKSILWPLGGFFNVFIYSRPKVKKLRESSDGNKNKLWLVLFAQVVRAGGEVRSAAQDVSPIVTSEEKEIPVNTEEAKKYDSVQSAARKSGSVQLLSNASKSLKGSLNHEEANRKYYTDDYRALNISCRSSEDDNSSAGNNVNKLNDIPEDSEC